ncbi:hypothetical protein ACVIM8_001284 [Bradyrhizobium sp. USDA 4529]
MSAIGVSRSRSRVDRLCRYSSGYKTKRLHRTLYCTNVSYRYRNVRRTIPTFAILSHSVLRRLTLIERSARVDDPIGQIVRSVRKSKVRNTISRPKLIVCLHGVIPVKASATAPQQTTPPAMARLREYSVHKMDKEHGPSASSRWRHRSSSIRLRVMAFVVRLVRLGLWTFNSMVPALQSSKSTYIVRIST